MIRARLIDIGRGMGPPATEAEAVFLAREVWRLEDFVRSVSRQSDEARAALGATWPEASRE
jgi:hypothetical protein